MSNLQAKQKAVHQGFTEEFYNQFNTIRTSFLISFFSGEILQDEIVQERISQKSFVEKATSYISFPLLAYKFKNEKDAFLSSYFGYCVKTLFVNLYEGFKTDPIRYSAVKDEDWYSMLRAFRSSFAHGIDGIWEIKQALNTNPNASFKRSDGQVIKLDPSWDGKKCDFEDMGGLFTIFDFVNFIDKEIRKKLSAEVVAKLTKSGVIPSQP